MSTEPIRLERRAGQRFEVHLPITIRVREQMLSGFSQDVSARGVFLYTEAALSEGDAVELTFTMPSEITLAESMRVRCQSRVLRSSVAGTGQRNGVAVHLDSYEYLPSIECESTTGVAQVSRGDADSDGSGAISH